MLMPKGSAGVLERFFVEGADRRSNHQGRLLRKGSIQAGLKKWTGFQQAEAGCAGKNAGGPGSRAKEGGLRGALRES